MKEQNDEIRDDEVRIDSLEQADVGESMRQLWWTIGVTVVCLAVLAYFTL